MSNSIDTQSSCMTDCFVAYWNHFVRFLSWSNYVLSWIPSFIYLYIWKLEIF
jgi:hypothetical protein